ncbi:hypothetical protein PGIGA_G00140630 [Pangasianodon gigas]|uniref:Uncharacterized protein n=1 Tax=Pangasianodon gigas TaxID=30993 RepID=A0ACC5XKZ0_PANGG|nr:hypothetical protein [Pangasianodon gigas]
MVWGCFSGVGLGPLLPVKGNVNASAYQDILDNAMLPTLWEQFGDGPFLFQHDCAPVHKARSIKTWLDEFGVEELDWPAQSPDLNPIEHLWGELERRLRARPSRPTSVPDLTNALLDEWAKIPTETLKSCGKPAQECGSCYSCKGGTNSILMSMYLECDVIKVPVGPVYEKVLSENRKMITNEQINLYNAAALSALNSGKRNAKARVKFLQASRQAAMETITQSEDGLHLPVSARNVGAMVLMNSLCNKILKPIDGSCCQSVPPLSVLQKLAAGLFLLAAVCFLVLHALGYTGHWKSKPVSDVESGEEKKPPTAAVPLIIKNMLQSICKMGLIMFYFYLCDRADIFMKEQKFYTHSTFFIPLIYIFMLGFFYNENTKEAKLLNREQTDEWKGWMQLVILVYHISGASAFIPVYMHVRVLVAAYLFQTGYGHFSFFWLKGDFGLYRVCQVLFRLNFLVVVLCLVMDRSYQFYYFVPLVTFWFVIIYATMAMWPQILQIKANGSSFWHLAVINGMLFAFIYLVLQKYQILSEGKGEPLFSTKISNCLLFVSVVSFILFICQYHIWLAADTKGILVLIPGIPSLNIIISTFIFVCVAHEISQITNDLAQVAIPKDSDALLKRLLATGLFMGVVLMLSNSSWA